MVRRSLKKLGQDLRTARLRRNVTVASLAERAGVSAGTILRLERGDPGVGLGTLAQALWLLGLNDRMMELADEGQDTIGLTLEAEQRRQRARPSKLITLDTTPNWPRDKTLYPLKKKG